MDDELAAMQAYYARDEERERLSAGVGKVEYLRTVEVVARTLPPAPAVVADIGGGPGRYTDWLVQTGYDVVHRDVVEHHVRQVAVRHGARIDAAVGDARSLDLADASVDAVLLLGPLYHLVEADDRAQALGEAARVVRPGGVVHAAAISRWASRLHGVLIDHLHLRYPALTAIVDEVERTGRMDPVHDGGFTGYYHTPGELRAEVGRAGLELESVVGLEGVAFALADLDERLADEDELDLLLRTLRAQEAVPELLGVSPHLLATARRTLAP